MDAGDLGPEARDFAIDNFAGGLQALAKAAALN